MTLINIFERLCSIDQEGQALLFASGFDRMDGFGPQVASGQNDPDTLFLKDRLYDLLKPFETLHEELQYLKSPCHGEFPLKQLPNGRYGYFDENGACHVFPCGVSLEAKIPDKYGRQHWVRSRIEHNGSHYFLWGYGSIPLSGLVVRERR